MNTFSRVAIALVGMTGLAAAQPKADAKAPAPPAAPTAKPADAKPADPMAEMKAPKEIADVAKAAGGTWKCKGQGMDHTMKMVDMAGTMKVKADMDNWWLHGTIELKMGKEPFRLESYSTFDPASKKWKRVVVETGGLWGSGESAGMKDGKLVWDLAMHSPMGDMMFRDSEDATDPKAGVKNMGEMSMDKGKTWMKVYEMTCKK